MLEEYLSNLFKVSKHGDATEATYYTTLQNFIETWSETDIKRKVSIVTLPKKTEAGNPDFRVWDGKQHIVGYMEAKAPTQENLEVIETSDQLKRYLHTFPNLI